MYSPARATTPVALRLADGEPLEIHPHQRRLVRGGALLTVGARAFDLLLALASRPGHVMSRHELLDQVWPDTAVEDNNLAVQVNALRKVLGHDAVATIPGRGYVLTARADRPAEVPAATPAPQADTALIGRAEDLATLGALVATQRLTTLVGAGGAGKTRLARALLPGLASAGLRTAFVELSAITTANGVSDAVAVALGLRLGDEGDALPLLLRALAPLQAFIVLDNAEHLVAAVAAAASALLAGAPGISLLVTSQAPLQVAGEHLYRLGGLAVPAADDGPAATRACAAVALFEASVQAQDRHFRLTPAQLSAVGELCRGLQGLPLSIELAAARLPLLGLDGLRQALQQPLQLLTQGRRDAPPRHQSLRATLAWSHALLDAAEQTVFRRMAVFVGGGALSMIQRVLSDEPATAGGLDAWAVMEALNTLVARSLVRALPVPPDAEPRYGLLDAPLALAREQLDAAGEAAALQRRHAQALGALAQEAHERLWASLGLPRPIDEAMAAEIGNGQAAVAWARLHDPALALRIATMLSRVLGANRYRERMALWRDLQPLLDAPRETSGLPVDVLGHAALQCAEAANYVTIEASAARAAMAHGWLAEAGDRRGCYVALCVWIRALSRLGDSAGLQTAMAGLQALEDPLWPPALRLMGAAAMGSWAAARGDAEAQCHWMHRSAALMRAAGRSDTVPLINLVDAERRAGRHAQAIQIARQVLPRLEGTRHQLELLHLRINLTQVLIEAGDLADARALLRVNWPAARQFDRHPTWADGAALLALAEGRPEAALQLQGYADHAYAETGSQRDAHPPAGAHATEARAREALAARLGEASLANLKLQGVALNETALMRLVFADAA